MKSLSDIAAETLALALTAGADAASVTVVDSRSLDASLLDGKLDHIERSESLEVQLQSFAGQSQAMVSSGSTSTADLTQLATRALAMARLAPPDRFAGLADKSEIATSFPDLELDDATEIEADQLMKNVAHIKDIVAMQQAYAKVSSILENQTPASLITEALRMTEAEMLRDGVTLKNECPATLPEVNTDRHKVLQILINIINNARQAMGEKPKPERVLTITLQLNTN
jgi:predicted Zn-dependent protease